MISKYPKIIVPFFLILTLVVLLKFYREYIDIQELKMMIAENESASVSHLIQAFRQTYQKAFSKHQIAIDEQTIELLPIRTINEIGKNFSQRMDNKITIRTISKNPMNRSNLAQSTENKFFQYFTQNPNEKSWLINFKNSGYLITEPIYVKDKCLKCHGKLEQVIPLIKTNYNTGFNYQVGDIIGIQLIRYEQNNFIQKLDFIYIRNILMASIVFLSIFGCIFLMLRIIAKKEAGYRLSLEQYNKELKRLSITDELTGLNNRAHYNQVVNKEINRARRDKKLLVFAMLDLDCFKKFNDIYGHHAGDQLLQSIGVLLKNVFNRSSDFTFRLGGEEFLALYYADSLKNVAYMAEQARKEIEKLNIEHKENTPYKIATTSIGLAVYNAEPELTSDILYNYADHALYRAKENGKNQVAIYTENG